MRGGSSDTGAFKFSLQEHKDGVLSPVNAHSFPHITVTIRTFPAICAVTLKKSGSTSIAIILNTPRVGQTGCTHAMLMHANNPFRFSTSVIIYSLCNLHDTNTYLKMWILKSFFFMLNFSAWWNRCPCRQRPRGLLHRWDDSREKEVLCDKRQPSPGRGLDNGHQDKES